MYFYFFSMNKNKKFLSKPCKFALEEKTTINVLNCNTFRLAFYFFSTILSIIRS